jgi:platelet-activating factor acetylhydrolase IB subunit alpha
MVLSERQQKELHVSMIEYLREMQYNQAADALEQEASVQAEDYDDKHKGLLERKWTTVTKLQKKVQELTKALEEAQQEARVPRARTNTDPSTWIPRPPATYAPLTSIALLLATAVVAVVHASLVTP